jgi:hypothetical protein
MIFVHPEDGQKGPKRALTKGKITEPAFCLRGGLERSFEKISIR